MKTLLEILKNPFQWYKTHQRLKELRKRDPFIYK